METIARLKEQELKARELLNYDEAALALAPLNFARRLSAESLRQHIEDLQSQLRHALELREKEVVELHLQGAHASYGRIPLLVLGKIAQSLAEAISNASLRVQSGVESSGRITKEISSLLNLQLSGIMPGSTRLFITGDTAPDLFGQSVIGESLERTFDLLAAESGEDLTQSISKVGTKTSKKLSELLKVLEAEEFEVELRWSSPSERNYEWKADVPKMKRITSTLESISELPPETLSVNGTLYMMSLKGSFEIHSNDGTSYKGQFPLALLKEIKPLHLGDEITAGVEKRIIQNRTTGVSKTFHTLLSISAV